MSYIIIIILGDISLLIFTGIFSLVDRATLFFIEFQMIFNESLKHKSNAFSQWLHDRACVASVDLSCIIISITICMSSQKIDQNGRY